MLGTSDHVTGLCAYAALASCSLCAMTGFFRSGFVVFSRVRAAYSGDSSVEEMAEQPPRPVSCTSALLAVHSGPCTRHAPTRPGPSSVCKTWGEGARGVRTRVPSGTRKSVSSSSTVEPPAGSRQSAQSRPDKPPAGRAQGQPKQTAGVIWEQPLICPLASRPHNLPLLA